MQIRCAQKSPDGQWNSIQSSQVLKMLCRLWYSPSTLIISASADKWASRAHQWITSVRVEDKDVPGLEGERRKLAQGAALSIMGPLNQYQHSHQRYAL
jgi:hypothetical protein